MIFDSMFALTGIIVIVLGFAFTGYVIFKRAKKAKAFSEIRDALVNDMPTEFNENVRPKIERMIDKLEELL